MMDEKSEHFCLKWNNYYGHVSDILVELLNANSMVDVTLCTQGSQIKAHRIILSACSSFFQEVLSNIDDSNPIIILCDTNFEDIKAIIEFIYSGELNVVAERFPSVLKIAEDLKIRGLMGVSNHLPFNLNSSPTLPLITEVPAPSVVTEIRTEESQINDINSSDSIHDEINPSDNLQNSEQTIIHLEEIPSFQETEVEETELELDLIQNEENQTEVKKRKLKKESTKKVYSERVMLDALDELRKGKSIVQTSSAHKIPRSTLYVRAKSMGVPTNLSRQEYSTERVRQAFKALAGGATLRQASELYKIPKTVLWRRVQKEDSVKMEGGLIHRRSSKPSYDASSKAEAIKALERGEKLTKVAQQYKIPKATLFREKTRLVESGKLPWNSLRRRVKDEDSRLQSRLNEAVQACKEGRMSHASAARTFQIPKTTIWRRMQQLGNARKSDSKCSLENSDLSDVSQNIGDVSKEMTHLQEQASFTFVEVPVSSQIPVTYIDEFPEASLIILTNEETENIPLEETHPIIVTTETEMEQETNEDLME